MIRSILVGMILKDKGRAVDVVGHVVKVTVVVEIGVRCAGGIRRCCKALRRGLIGERKVAIIPEVKTRKVCAINTLECLQKFFTLGQMISALHELLHAVAYKIAVRNVTRIAVGNEQVFPSVVV